MYDKVIFIISFWMIQHSVKKEVKRMITKVVFRTHENTNLTGWAKTKTKSWIYRGLIFHSKESNFMQWSTTRQFDKPWSIVLISFVQMFCCLINKRVLQEWSATRMFAGGTREHCRVIVYGPNLHWNHFPQNKYCQIKTQWLTLTSQLGFYTLRAQKDVNRCRERVFCHINLSQAFWYHLCVS